MDIDKLFQEEQNDAAGKLDDLLFDNEETIAYFKGTEKKVKRILESGDIEKIKKVSKKLSKRMDKLSALKFTIFELEDDIPDDLQKEWDKLINYITENMGWSEVDLFENKLLAIKNKVEVNKVQEQKREQELLKENEPIIAYDYNIKRIVSQEIQRLKQKNKRLDLNCIDVSNVTVMEGLFAGLSDFNVDICKWDVSSVENMREMFSGSKFKGDISNWDVSSVRSMNAMFKASQFNGDISNWDVSSVENMFDMFHLSQFNGDISKWDVSSVKNMCQMFCASKFDRNISDWNVSSVLNMQTMFYKSQFNGDISNWDVSSVEKMNSMIVESKFKGDISTWAKKPPGYRAKKKK